MDWGFVKSALSMIWGRTLKWTVQNLGTRARPYQNPCPFSWVQFKQRLKNIVTKMYFESEEQKLREENQRRKKEGKNDDPSFEFHIIE